MHLLKEYKIFFFKIHMEISNIKSIVNKLN